MIKQSAPSVVFYAAEERLSELSQERHRIDADIGTAAKVMAMYEKERGDNLAIMQDLAKWLGDQHSESESDPDAYFRIYDIPKQTSAGGESE